MKTYTIRYTRMRRGEYVDRDVTGTLPELIKYFGYTLERGRSWEHERGNKKINTNPKTVRSLVVNLNNAENNAAANGWANVSYMLVG